MSVFLLALSAVIASPPAWAEEEHQTHPARQAVPPPTHRLPVVGERLSFHGRWFWLPIGHGWIEVKEIVELDGRRAYHIEAQGHSNDVLSAFYPVHDVIHSYLDVETLRPLRFEKRQREGTYRADEVVTFDLDAGTASYRSLLNQSEKTIDLPYDFQDLISALYWFRAQPLAPPETLTVNLYTDEKIYQTDIEVTQPVPLELLKRGTFRCLVVEPKAAFKGVLVKRGRLWAYLTADAYRLPLLVKATTPWGSMSAVIDEASIPEAIERHPSVLTDARSEDANTHPARP